MTDVASSFASWLKAQALYVTANGGGAAKWGGKAKNSEAISPFAAQANGAAEAARQASFMSGPFGRDTMLVAGRRADLVGFPVTLTGDRLGYEAGATVFVLEADETTVPGHTQLTVLKRL